MSDYRTLTEQRIEMIAMVADGHTNLQIANLRGTSEDAIKTAVHRASRFLGARNRAHLVYLAHARGYLTAEPVKTFITPTRRRLEVIAQVANGFTNLEIGTGLFLSENTVKTHLRNASRQMRARSRAHLVHLAYVRGLLIATPHGAAPPVHQTSVVPALRTQPRPAPRPRGMPARRQPLFVKRGLLFMAAGGAR